MDISSIHLTFAERFLSCSYLSKFYDRWEISENLNLAMSVNSNTSEHYSNFLSCFSWIERKHSKVDSRNKSWVHKVNDHNWALPKCSSHMLIAGRNHFPG